MRIAQWCFQQCAKNSYFQSYILFTDGEYFTRDNAFNLHIAHLRAHSMFDNDMHYPILVNIYLVLTCCNSLPMLVGNYLMFRKHILPGLFKYMAQIACCFNTMEQFRV